MKILYQIKLNVLAKTEFHHYMKNTKLSYFKNFSNPDICSVGILSHYNKMLLTFDMDTLEPIDINIPLSISSLRRTNVVLGLTNKVLTRNSDGTFSLYEKGKLLIYTDQDNISKVGNVYISYCQEETSKELFSTEQDKKNNFCRNYGQLREPLL